MFSVSFSPLLIAVEVVTSLDDPDADDLKAFQSAFNRGRGCNSDCASYIACRSFSFSPLLIAVEVVTYLLKIPHTAKWAPFQSAFNRGRGCNFVMTLEALC